MNVHVPPNFQVIWRTSGSGLHSTALSVQAFTCTLLTRLGLPVAACSRFYDVTGGAICVGGVNIRDLEQLSLRRLIGMVPQVRQECAYSRPRLKEVSFFRESVIHILHCTCLLSLSSSRYCLLNLV